MKLITNVLIAAALIIIALPTVFANDVPNLCMVNPVMSYDSDEFGTYIWTNANLNNDCPLATENDMQTYVELVGLTQRVERRTRIGNTVSWSTEVVGEYTYGAIDLLNGQIDGLFNVGMGANITGKSVGEYYQYRYVVTVYGSESHSTFAPYAPYTTFGGTFATEWTPGPDVVKTTGASGADELTEEDPGYESNGMGQFQVEPSRLTPTPTFGTLRGK